MKKDYDEERNQAIWLRSIVPPSGGASDGFESSAVNRMRKRGVLLGNTAVYDMTYEAKKLKGNLIMIKIMRWAFFLCIFLLFTLHTVSAEEIVWDDRGEITLKLGDKYSLDPYAIQAVDFDRDRVLLTLYKYDKTINSWVLKTGEDFVYNDEIKINQSEVFPGANGFAKLHLWKRAVPDFVISFETEKDTYPSGSYIPVTINIKNDGNVTAKSVTVTLDPGELELVAGQVKKYYDTINAKTQVSYSVTVAAPVSPKKSTFTLIAAASGYDEKNINYKGYGSKSLTVLSSLYIEKTVEGKKIDNVPYVYWGTPSNVSIRVLNIGNSDVKGIKVEDSITDDFEPVSLSFPPFDLSKGEEKIIKYTIIPKKPGRYTLPKANVSFVLNNEKVKLETEKQELIVGGAYIELTKDYEILDEKGLVQVTVTAQNIGDMPAKAVISENPPDNIKLLGSAYLNRNVTLEPGEKEIISYLASIPEKVDLPPTAVRYNNLSFESNKISIVLPEYKPEQKKEEKKSEIPQDLGYFPAIALSVLFGLALIATVKNGMYSISVTIERSGDRKIITTTLGMAILVLSLFLLIMFTIFLTQNLMEEKYTVFLVYLLIFGSIIRYIETKKVL